MAKLAGFSRTVTSGLWLAGLAFACSIAAQAKPHSVAAAQSSWVGIYNGSQMELAAELELRADGRFRYALSYGALDEQAQGSWKADATGVRLTSDPVVAPRFAAIEAKAIPEARLHVDLDVPAGISRQFFVAQIAMADGRARNEQLSDEGLDLQLAPDDHPLSIAMVLPVFDVRGEPLTLPAGRGAIVHFRFDPNDLGKVAFADQRLQGDKGALLFERYDRQIRFRRSAR